GQILGMFVKNGPAMQVESRNANGNFHNLILMIPPGNRPLWLGPLVVMTDQMSASGSEALSGTLQDYKRAIVVGTTTFGKGSAQSKIPLESGLVMWLTK